MKDNTSIKLDTYAYQNLDGTETTKEVILKKVVTQLYEMNGVDEETKKEIQYLVELDGSGLLLDDKIRFSKLPNKEEIHDAIIKLRADYYDHTGEKPTFFDNFKKLFSNGKTEKKEVIKNETREVEIVF
jgi:hypothetical protein